MLNRFFKKKELDENVHQVHLPEKEADMYYSKELKCYVERGKEEEKKKELAESNKPPPKKMNTQTNVVNKTLPKGRNISRASILPAESMISEPVLSHSQSMSNVLNSSKLLREEMQIDQTSKNDLNTSTNIIKEEDEYKITDEESKIKKSSNFEDIIKQEESSFSIIQNYENADNNKLHLKEVIIKY